MLTLRKASDRGYTKTEWVDSYHTFSFAEYHDPKFTHFGCLRVINDDYIKADAGFGMHPHSDMEIITYLLDGELEHRDSLGNGSLIRKGDVQRMSAGTGVLHSEFNPSPDNNTHLLQIWIFPEFKDLMPAYEQVHITDEEKLNHFHLIASKHNNIGTVTIHQDALIYAGLFVDHTVHEYHINKSRQVYLHMARGKAIINGIPVSLGDGLMLVDEQIVILDNADNAEVLLFDLPSTN
ncbi:MAG: pirin family protein [Gammaproteobacteria bacterium]